MAFYVCANSFVRFARYCGKMYSRHLFPYGGLGPLNVINFSTHNVLKSPILVPGHVSRFRYIVGINVNEKSHTEKILVRKFISQITYLNKYFGLSCRIIALILSKVLFPRSA